MHKPQHLALSLADLPFNKGECLNVMAGMANGRGSFACVMNKSQTKANFSYSSSTVKSAARVNKCNGSYKK